MARGSTRPSSSDAFRFVFFHKTRPGDRQSTENQNLEGEPDLAGDSDLGIFPDLEGHPGFERALSDVDPFPKARERILNGNARHANNNQRARYAPRVPPHQPGHEEVGGPLSIAFSAKWNRLRATATRRPIRWKCRPRNCCIFRHASSWTFKQTVVGYEHAMGDVLFFGRHSGQSYEDGCLQGRQLRQTREEPDLPKQFKQNFVMEWTANKRPT